MKPLLYAPVTELTVLAELLRCEAPGRTILDHGLNVYLFTDLQCRRLFSAITQTLAADQPVTIAALEQMLELGDLAVLNTAFHENVSAANLPNHIRLLRECHDRRQQKAARDRAAKMLAFDDVDLDAVKAVLDTAADPNLARMVMRSHEADEQIEMLPGESIRPEAVRWLWDGWLAEGKIHLIAGPGGTGKTTTAMALAATVSSGGRWPSGEWTEARNVVIWTGEDGLADTLVPRLIACGANMKRVSLVGGVTRAGSKRSFDPATDILPLQNALLKIGNVGLLIVDPIVSAVAGDSHKNGEVRRSLQPLVDLAMTTRCTVLGITHFSKATTGRDPVERVTGSIAFSALARVVMAVVKVGNSQGEGRLLVRAKSNLGPDTDGYKFDVRQKALEDHPDILASYVAWGDVIKGDARDLLGQAETVPNAEEHEELDAAKTFLRELLADGPMYAKQIREESDGAGYSWRTVERAKKDMGIIAAKNGMKDGWRWQIPHSSSE